MKKTNKIFVITFVLIIAVLGRMGAFIYNMYSDVTTEQKRGEQIKVHQEDPFSIAQLDIKKGDFEREDQEPLDSIIVITVNSQTSETENSSIPWDADTPIIRFSKKYKSIHPYAFGDIQTVLNTIHNLLKIVY